MSHIVERSGQVVGFDGARAVVRLESAPGCGACGSRGTCGAAGRTPPLIRMALPTRTRIGDRIVLSMPASSVALAAALGYLLPPACLLAGAVAGAFAYGGDAAAAAGAGLGLAAGLWLARLLSRFALGRGLDLSVCGCASSNGDFR